MEAFTLYPTLLIIFLFSYKTFSLWSGGSILLSSFLYLLYLKANYRNPSTIEPTLISPKIPTTASKSKNLKKLTIAQIELLIRNDDFLGKSAKIIKANLSNEALDVLFLATEMCMARVTLYREIKKRTGRTAITFIKLMRLIEAHQLLLTSEHPISAIAYEVGFKAPSHFSTSYKKEYRCTPKQTRRKKLAS